MDGSRDAELYHILERHRGEVPITGCGAVGLLLVAGVGSASVGRHAVLAAADIVVCHYVTLFFFVTTSLLAIFISLSPDAVLH